mmetsp:Transcript_3423/g.5669  ORF Transcript_3423/g.5669 Transcript_3423/m.5669 type:complete len:205 (+) Transcript_3423:264-878(+)
MLGHLLLRRRELVQKSWRNSEAVASGKLQNFVRVAEGCAHDDGVVSVLLVVVVDGRYRLNTRIFFWLESIDTLILLVPIHDTTDKRRNERAVSFGTSNRLSDAENKRQVACDTLFLKNSSSLDSLPSGSDFDKDAALVDALLLVEANQLACLDKSSFRVERQASIDLGGDVSWNLGCDFSPKVDGTPVHDIGKVSLTILDSLIN